MIKVVAPSNIALIKYWGKASKDLKLAKNSSLSISLNNLNTTTIITKADKDIFILNDRIEDFNKIKDFVALFRKNPENKILVNSKNNFPTAAGLASSASGYAALGMALKEYFKLNLSLKELSILVRKGSGSACRSLFSNFAVWKHSLHDRNSFVFKLNKDLNLQAMIMLCSQKEKQQSSRSMMELCLRKSRSYPSFLRHARTNLKPLIQAIKTNNFKKIASISINNMRLMHNCIHDLNFTYLNKDSYRVIRTMHKLTYKYPVFYTIDAGSNIVCIAPKSYFLKMKKELLKLNIKYLQSDMGKGPYVIN